MPVRPAKSSSEHADTSDIRPFPALKALPETDRPRPESEAPAPVVEAPAQAPEKPRRKRSAKTFLLPIIGLALLGAGAWYGHGYWTEGRFMISTDDAYVQADMAFVSPKIAGYVDRVDVTENQHVKAGDPLVLMDDGDYRISVEQASAQIATAGKTLDRITAQIDAARAAQKQAEAQKASTVASGQNADRSADRASS